jgi:hypothetical protein
VRVRVGRPGAHGHRRGDCFELVDIQPELEVVRGERVDRREEVVADGVADDIEWAPSECPDEIATAEVDQVKAKSIKRDIPFALRRGTIGQVTTALDAAKSAAEDELLALNRRAGGLGSLNSFFLLC